MANYLCDVLRIHKSNRTDLIAALRPRQWGMAEDTYNRIIAKTLCGNTREFWPRINDNIALRGNWLSNSGGDSGIRVTDAGLVGFNVATPLRPIHVIADSGDICIRFEGKTGAGSQYGMIGITEGYTSINFYHTAVKVMSLALCGANEEVKLYKDINSDAWQTYFASVVTGLEAAGLDKRIKFKKIGNLVFVNFHLDGTTTNPGALISFTVPYKGKEDIAGYFPVNYKDDSSYGTGAFRLAYLNASNKVYIGKDYFGSVAFSNAVNANVSGQFFYEVE